MWRLEAASEFHVERRPNPTSKCSCNCCDCGGRKGAGCWGLKSVFCVDVIQIEKMRDSELAVMLL